MQNKDLDINEHYWNEFYKKNHRHTPSQFCVCVLTEIERDSAIVEFGSGNGRDSHYFASQGHITFAMDLSQQAIKTCEDLTATREIRHARFIRGDVTDSTDVVGLVGLARDSCQGRPLVFYSRFVMHTLDDRQEEAFLRILSEVMRPNESVYFEFRSKEDADLDKHFGGHYRRYIDADDFRASLETRFGFEVGYFIVGQGMAKYKEEDPYVSRLIAIKV